MKTLAFHLGTWGAALGMLAGLIETTVGASIRPWIGNKENPLILGLVTLFLSGLAWITIRLAQKNIPSTADKKLATILGVLVPAGVCFTTVGALWYLPGILLSVSAYLLITHFWRNRPRTAAHLWRWISGLGALACLLSFGLAFWNPLFGLFRLIIPARTDHLMLEILPMDVLRRTVDAFGVARVETFESGAVMAVYLLLTLGAGVSLLASLASSRLFAKIGGGMSLAGMLFFLLQLPAILRQAHFQSTFPLWTSLGVGWYLFMLGTALILLGAFWQGSKAGALSNSNLETSEAMKTLKLGWAGIIGMIVIYAILYTLNLTIPLASSPLLHIQQLHHPHLVVVGICAGWCGGGGFVHAASSYYPVCGFGVRSGFLERSKHLLAHSRHN